MKSRLLALCLMAASCVPLSAAPWTFVTTLGNFEEPPTGSPGTGMSFVTIDPVAHTMDLQAWFSGLLGPTTASHIHVINGPGDSNTADTNGPVATTVPTFPGFPLGVMSGNYQHSFNTLDASTYNPAFVTNSGSLEQAEAELFAAISSGRAYLNIHTEAFRSGEIRGFFTPVPEPGTWGLMVGALGGLALLKRRRAR